MLSLQSGLTMNIQSNGNRLELKVKRGREQLCGECQQTVLLRMMNLNHRWIPLSQGYKDGLDTIECEEDSPESRLVMEALGKHISDSSEKHDHREWNSFLIKTKETEIVLLQEEIDAKVAEIVKLRELGCNGE